MSVVLPRQLADILSARRLGETAGSIAARTGISARSVERVWLRHKHRPPADPTVTPIVTGLHGVSLSRVHYLSDSDEASEASPASSRGEVSKPVRVERVLPARKRQPQPPSQRDSRRCVAGPRLDGGQTDVAQERKRESQDQVLRLWKAGRNTDEIGKLLGCPEHKAYALLIEARASVGAGFVAALKASIR